MGRGKYCPRPTLMVGIKLPVCGLVGVSRQGITSPSRQILDAADQIAIDNYKMQQLDGIVNEWGWCKQKLGANAILAVSLAVCKAGASVKKGAPTNHVADFEQDESDSDSDKQHKLVSEIEFVIDRVLKGLRGFGEMTDQELELELNEAGTRLGDPPSLVDDLLGILDKLESCLTKVEQSPSESMRNAMEPSLKALASENIREHSDVDVKVAAASCVSEITRITAPDAPFENEQMRQYAFQVRLIDVKKVIIVRLLLVSAEAIYARRSSITIKSASICMQDLLIMHQRRLRVIEQIQIKMMESLLNLTRKIELPCLRTRFDDPPNNPNYGTRSMMEQQR
ncbi:hypothetical protein Syun_026472 [Stephania yunnanensis]|uniref:Enolase N-terminal domain-containing protein n=1 Tax=Stephania yunnanensis TaxID=152371 RepID=A0AAP0EWF1_9MAGN